jgi:hypothetical protein
MSDADKNEQAPVEDPKTESKPAKEYNLKSPVDVARKGMDEKYATMCCCCVCVCEDEETKDQKCCFCLPIKCGVQIIAASIIIITLVQFIEIFYQLLNDDIEWWYVLVGVAVSIPIIIAFGLTIYFFAEDDDSTRVGMQSAGILVVISVALLAAWNACYFTLLYKSDKVTTGNDGVGFITVTVKQQVVFSLWIATVVCAFFAYYLCILSQYKNLYRAKAVKDWLEANPEKKEGDDETDPLNKDKEANEGEEGNAKDAEAADK